MEQQINFPEALDEIKTKVTDLAKLTLKSYLNDAKSDAWAIVEKLKDDVQRWTTLLAEGKLKDWEVEWLINNQINLIELTALKQAGLAQIRIDAFKNNVINIVIEVIFKILRIV